MYLYTLRFALWVLPPGFPRAEMCTHVGMKLMEVVVGAGGLRLPLGTATGPGTLGWSQLSLWACWSHSYVHQHSVMKEAPHQAGVTPIPPLLHHSAALRAHL